MRALVQQVQNVLAEIDEFHSILQEGIAEWEADGFRIVEGSGTITDYRTKEVVATGVKTSRWPKDWYHVDHIWEEADGLTTLAWVDGLPNNLIMAINEWAYSNPEEARDWISGIASEAMP